MFTHIDLSQHAKYAISRFFPKNRPIQVFTPYTLLHAQSQKKINDSILRKKYKKSTFGPFLDFFKSGSVTVKCLWSPNVIQKNQK